MNKENGRKSWRRLTIGALWFVSFMWGFFHLAAKGHGLEVIQLYVYVLTVGFLFFGGFITATDILDRIKK